MNKDNTPIHNDDISITNTDEIFDDVWQFFVKWSMAAGTIFGIPVRIHFLNVLWLGLILYRSKATSDIFSILIIDISIIIALTLHEMAHALVARYLGSAVKGIILMLPLGALACIKLDTDKPLVRLSIIISGPLINLFTALAIYLITTNSHFSMHSYYLKSFLHYLFIISLTNGIFNLIPLYPMDGGRLVKDFLLLCKTGNSIADTATLVVSAASFIILVLFSIKETFIQLFIIALIMMIIATLDLLFKDRLQADEEIQLDSHD